MENCVDMLHLWKWCPHIMDEHTKVLIIFKLIDIDMGSGNLIVNTNYPVAIFDEAVTEM